jgi:glycerol-3-phosphate dehydrogenase
MSGKPASAGVLNAHSRRDALAALATEELDVLVIGGGIVGAGCALDAAARGLKVGVVEAQDWASGTSSRSSKLVHGGIRYLEQLDFHLVHEALGERGLLLNTLAPHLVKPIRFLYPVSTPVWERAYVGAGMLLYDLFALSTGKQRGVSNHKHLSKRQVGLAAPSLAHSAITGGMSYFDGRVDDARYVVNLVRTAVAHGALAANRTSVTGFIQDGGQVTGVTAVDGETGTEFTIKAKQVINATGVWTGEIQKLVEDGGTLKVRASKGIHIVVPRNKFKSVMGLLLRTEKSVLFVIPWGRHWIIGTTDTEWSFDKDNPAATATDIQYLLDHINAVIDDPITHDDIEGVYVGLRPLLASKSTDTTKLSREHVVVSPKPGLVLIAGGKWTTYRIMAKDGVNAAVKALPSTASIPASTTAQIPLLGANGYHQLWSKKKTLAKDSGLSEKVIEHLLNRYGALAMDVLDLIAEDSSLASALEGNPDYLQAEVLYAIRFEGALHIEDVLARRTRYDIETKDRGVAVAEFVGQMMATELGWNTTRTKAEVQYYRDSIGAALTAEQLSTDKAANAVRTDIPSLTQVVSA